MSSAVDILEERVVAAADLIASLRAKVQSLERELVDDSRRGAPPARPASPVSAGPRACRGTRAAARRAGRGPREHSRTPPGNRPGVLVSTGHLTVRIYGENYPLRTAEPAARLEELARYVDARMREVAASGKVVVTSKIAVLAALHIADELFRLREAPAREPGTRRPGAAAGGPRPDPRARAGASPRRRVGRAAVQPLPFASASTILAMQKYPCGVCDGRKNCRTNRSGTGRQRWEPCACRFFGSGSLQRPAVSPLGPFGSRPFCPHGTFAGVFHADLGRSGRPLT